MQAICSTWPVPGAQPPTRPVRIRSRNRSRRRICSALKASLNIWPEVTEFEQDDDEDADEDHSSPKSGDALYDEATDIVLRDRKVSISYIQRRLSIGYNKAATLIERMEEEGLISPPNRAGKRQILVN